MENNNTKIKWYKSQWVSSIAGGLVVPAIIYVFGYINIIPVINEIKKSVDTLNLELMKTNTKIEEINNCYIMKNKDGVDMKVGINSTLEGNFVTVYEKNSLNLKELDRIVTQNLLQANGLKPDVNLVVIKVVERDGDESNAEMFISIVAAKILGLTELKANGVFHLKVHKLEKDK
jgi:hypothetical protein